MLADPAGGLFHGFGAPPLPLQPGSDSIGWAVFGTQGWYYVTAGDTGLETAAFTPYFALTERDRGRLSYLAKIDITENRERLPDGVPVEVEFVLNATSG